MVVLVKREQPKKTAMKIVRPVKDYPDLVLVYDLIDKQHLSDLLKNSISSFYYSDADNITDDVRAELGYLPPKQDKQIYQFANSYVDEIRSNTIKVMNSEYGDFTVERFQDFGKPGLRCNHLQPSMKPHVDGPPEYNNPNHGIENLGANFYLNDDYEGGEIYYPNIGFSYKPVPNSLLIHRGIESFRHGVKEVTSGWRFGFGMFGFDRDYELPPLEVGIDSDR